MENRQRITLYDQMISGNTSNNNNTRISLASLIKNDAVLTNQKTPNQTLLDIIRENEPNNNNNNVVNVNVNNNRKSWKGFKELLRLKRRNSDESTHQQQNDAVRDNVVNNSDLTEFLAGGESSDEEINVNISETAAQVSMSLMDLLEESEIELDRSSDVNDDDVDQNHEEEEEEEKGNVKVEHNCCVCMVRHKGAA
ncbi:hypothetical protein L195_g051476, partial [Trifolium pratense]